MGGVYRTRWEKRSPQRHRGDQQQTEELLTAKVAKIAKKIFHHRGHRGSQRENTHKTLRS